MTKANEREILIAAAAKLEGMLPTTWSSSIGQWPATITTASALPLTITALLPMLVRMLRETADEYEPDTVVICQHCWDNVNIARVVLGLEPDYQMDAADDE